MSKLFSKEEHEIMKQNGIEYATARLRLKRGMSKQEAISKPVRKKTNYKEIFEPYKELAERNGVKYETWRERVTSYNYTPQQAAEMPLYDKRPPKRNPYRQLAESNGISTSTFSRRLKKGWSQEDAATTPPLKRKDQFIKFAECRQQAIEKDMLGIFYHRIFEQDMDFEEAIQN